MAPLLRWTLSYGISAKMNTILWHLCWDEHHLVAPLLRWTPSYGISAEMNTILWHLCWDENHFMAPLLKWTPSYGISAKMNTIWWHLCAEKHHLMAPLLKWTPSYGISPMKMKTILALPILTMIIIFQFTWDFCDDDLVRDCCFELYSCFKRLLFWII